MDSLSLPNVPHRPFDLSTAIRSERFLFKPSACPQHDVYTNTAFRAPFGRLPDRFTVPPEHEEGYLTLLRQTDLAVDTIMAHPGTVVFSSGGGNLLSGRATDSAGSDYQPIPDMSRFPRTNVHLPDGADNPTKGWAWRADIGDPLDATGSDKLLQGKSVALKDTICVAEVPLLYGTDAFEGYVRAFPTS